MFWTWCLTLCCSPGPSPAPSADPSTFPRKFGESSQNGSKSHPAERGSWREVSKCAFALRFPCTNARSKLIKNNTEKELRDLTLGWGSQLELMALLPFQMKRLSNPLQKVPVVQQRWCHTQPPLIPVDLAPCLSCQRRKGKFRESNSPPGLQQSHNAVVFSCILLSRIIKKFRTSLEPHHRIFTGSQVTFL